MSLPLEGVRVLDLATTFSGPYCTRNLADLGADVVKIEGPSGDITRGLGDTREPGRSSVFVSTNRGKSSVRLDLKQPADREFFGELLAKADVLVHNMRLQAAEHLGIGPAQALAANPRLIHLAVTGYGSDGPYAGRPAYDDTIQAMSGLAWVQGFPDEPSYVAAAVADKVVGMLAATAVSAALYRRTITGRGEAVEVPMFETMVGFNLMEQWGGRAFVPTTGPTGYSRMRTPHRRPYQTSDGVIAVMVYTEGHWRRFLDSIGQGALLEQPEYATVEARSRNIDSLYGLLSRTLRTRTTAEWLRECERLDVPAAEVKTLDELFDDEHLRAVELFQEFGDDDARYLGARSSLLWGVERPRAASIREQQVDELGGGLDAARRWLTDEREPAKGP